MEYDYMNKPSWLSRAKFEQFLRAYNNNPRCVVTGWDGKEAAEHGCKLTIDHVVPKYNGGSDEIGNLQPLVDYENVKKSTRPDGHWSQQFYWDQTPNLDALRGAQRSLFQTIVDEPWFRRPISEIAGHLYLAAWVVGSGKTLGIPTAAWAINHVIKDRWGASPRADRVLVVTKEQAVRDQIANDLRKDIVKYGIASHPPKIAVIEEGSQLSQDRWLKEHDIVVTCAQMLWDRGSGNPLTDTKVAELLDGFKVIAFDEPHYAAGQVYRLVQLAARSLCIGFTGTPIDGLGGLLDRMVQMSTWDYDEANTYDRGLRWLDNGADSFPRFVRELGIVRANVIEYGKPAETDDVSKQDYKLNAIPARSVVDETIGEMLRRDQLAIATEQVAEHRDQPDVVMAAAPYVSHGMVVCDSVVTAREYCRQYNDQFKDDRATYRKEMGWQASVVHSDSPEFGSQSLGVNHPWMRYKNNGYRIDDKCHRLLFVVGIGREGVNNPACGPIGVACTSSSIVEWVQRAIGRQLRAVTSFDEGKFVVPPSPLDSVLIITHRTFGNALAAKTAIDFVCNMTEHLSSLPTIAQLRDSDSIPTDIQDRDFSMERSDKFEIAARLGQSAGESPFGRPDVDTVVKTFLAPLEAQMDLFDDGTARAKRVKEWADKVVEDRDGARKELRLGVSLSPRLIVTDEQVRQQPSDVELERYLRIHKPHLLGKFLPISEMYRFAIVEMYCDHFDKYKIPITSDTDLEKIRLGLRQKVKAHLGGNFEGDSGAIPTFVNAAIKRVLGASEVNVKKDWDIPQVHHMLRRSDVQSDILSWVTDRLISKGYCPSLKILSGRSDWLEDECG